MPKWTATCSRLGRQDSGSRKSTGAYWQWPSSSNWAHATARSRSRNFKVTFSSCVSWHRLLDSVLFFRMIPASIDGRCWYWLYFAVRVICLLQLSTKPMRYIYHPQHNCYFSVILPLCCRPCELTLRTLVILFFVSQLISLTCHWSLFSYLPNRNWPQLSSCWRPDNRPTVHILSSLTLVPL